ncbi:MAG: caspase family protein, partial [Nitrospirae bacterium]|nr:caspase family protein [Nitrospirota bacterium]
DIDTAKEIRTFRGHFGPVTSIAIPPDGRHVLSASEDKTLKLWDIASGRELKTFTGHSDKVHSVAISPNGKYALSASEDKTLKMWDITSGRELRTFTGHADKVHSVVITPDGKYALSASEDKTLKLWDIATGRELRTFIGHSKGVRAVALSPDGKYALSASGDNVPRPWDLTTGRELRTLKKGFYPVAITHNGRHALVATLGTSLKMWDLATGREVTTFKGSSTPVQHLALSPDGRYVLSGDAYSDLKMLDINTGKEVKNLKGYADLISYATLSPDGKYALSGGCDRTLKLWDMTTGSVKTLTEYTEPVNAVIMPADDPHTGAKAPPMITMPSNRIKGYIEAVNSAAISHDGKYVVSSWDHTMQLWDIASGRAIKTFKGHSNYIYSVAISHNGRYVLSGSRDKTLKLWDIDSGNELRTFSGHSDKVTSVALSRNDKYALSGSWDKTLKLWDTASGNELRTFTGHSDKVTSVALSSDGRYALSGSNDKTLKLWDIASGKALRTFTGHSGRVTSVALSHDGKYTLSGSNDKTLKLWDIASGKALRTFTGHRGGGISVSLSHDGRYVLSAGTSMDTVGPSPEYGDKTLRLWNIATGKELVQFVSFIDGQWVAFTPEGYYSASADGEKYINVRTGNTVYGIDQYKAVYYNPQIVEAALKTGNIQQAVAQVSGANKEMPVAADIRGIMPPSVVIKSPDNNGEVYSQLQDISINIKDDNHAVKQVRVLINGREVTANASSRTIKIPKGQKTIALKVPVKLDTGENLIEVFASNGYSEGRKNVRVTFAPTTKPTLWILSVGINRYDNKQIPAINYAANDAEAIVAAFEEQKGKLFREVNSLIISDLSDIKPTYDNIVKNLDYLAKATADDVVVLFISGQGITDNHGAYYLLPSNAGFNDDGSVDPSTAISGRELKSALDIIPSRKLVFADTSHANWTSGGSTRGVDNDGFVGELRDVKTVIFTASRARELSLQSDKWQQGVFTYATIRGMAGKGMEGEGTSIKTLTVTMKQLATYISERIPKLTNGSQHPMTHIPQGYVNFPVAVIDLK